MQHRTVDEKLTTLRQELEDMTRFKEATMDGMKYDFENGFGTTEEFKSYLLLRKITPKGDSNNIVVAATRIELVTLGL